MVKEEWKCQNLYAVIVIMIRVLKLLVRARYVKIADNFTMLNQKKRITKLNLKIIK
jgi:hypothetical protein